MARVQKLSLLNVFNWVNEHFCTQYETTEMKENSYPSLVCKITSSVNSIVTWAQGSASVNPILQVKEPRTPDQGI